MHPKRILILDYSVDKSETASIKACLPADVHVSSLFIDTEESFSDNLCHSAFSHVIHSGSALSITESAPFTEKAVDYIREIRNKGVPQMGICYGHQLVCLALVGKHAVRSSPKGLEAGWKQVTFSNDALRLLGVGTHEIVWEHHFDEVSELPEGSELLATNSHSGIQAYINDEQALFGTQFHPEIDRETGNKIFARDRELLEKHNCDVDATLKQGPSFDTGKVCFDFFLGRS